MTLSFPPPPLPPLPPPLPFHLSQKHLKNGNNGDNLECEEDISQEGKTNFFFFALLSY